MAPEFVNDPFLIVTRVSTEQGAMTETLKAALQQRQNKVYSRDEIGNERLTFRFELARMIRAESQLYVEPIEPVLDDQHCAAIRRISESLSTRYGQILKDGRFRYGTAQKAFNLYLKFLWRLGMLGEGKPPHCPVDGIVLAAAGLTGSWTWSDDEQELTFGHLDPRALEESEISIRSTGDWKDNCSYQAWVLKKCCSGWLFLLCE